MGRPHVKFHEDRCKGEAVMRQKPFSVILALWPWPLTPTSIGSILDSWGDCMWSFMKIGVKGKQLYARNHFQKSLHCDLDLWPFYPKFNRAHSWLMGRLHVKFYEDRCKMKAVMRLKPFYLTAQSLHCDLDLWPLDPKVQRAHTWLMGRLHMKFHDRCKRETVMRQKPFSVILALWPWPLTFWPQIS